MRPGSPRPAIDPARLRYQMLQRVRWLIHQGVAVPQFCRQPGSGLRRQGGGRAGAVGWRVALTGSAWSTSTLQGFFGGSTCSRRSGGPCRAGTSMHGAQEAVRAFGRRGGRWPPLPRWRPRQAAPALRACCVVSCTLDGCSSALPSVGVPPAGWPSVPAMAATAACQDCTAWKRVTGAARRASGRLHGPPAWAQLPCASCSPTFGPSPLARASIACTAPAFQASKGPAPPSPSTALAAAHRRQTAPWMGEVKALPQKDARCAPGWS